MFIAELPHMVRKTAFLLWSLTPTLHQLTLGPNLSWSLVHRFLVNILLFFEEKEESEVSAPFSVTYQIL